MTHAELIKRTVRWLKTTLGCSVVFTEMSTAASEIPDAIGWRYGRSVLVECKASRADFRADQGKSWRKTPGLGMGSERYYFAPPGVISLSDLPAGWGLAECGGRHVRILGKSTGFEQRNILNELLFLSSMVRRAEIRLGQDLCEYIRSIPQDQAKEPARQESAPKEHPRNIGCLLSEGIQA